MAVKTYSLRTNGASQLLINFRVREFACKDGSDKILIDDDLVIVLQKIRIHFGKPVTINSGYRTASYNAKIGGSPNSQHLNGKAADIRVSDVTPLAVAQYAEIIGVGGIGHAPAGQGNFVHVDTRAARGRWEYYNGGKNTRPVSGFGGATPAPTPPPMAGATINIGPLTIAVNGQERTARAGLVGDENYVHLRDFVAALGGVVGYDEQTRRISVTV